MVPDASRYAIVISFLPIPQLPHPSSCCLWYHPHHLALSTPLRRHHPCPTTSWNQAHFLHHPTTLSGVAYSSISSTCSTTAPSSGTAPALDSPVAQATASEPLSPPPASPRPCRVRRPPKRFEPETGLWVPH